MEIHIGKKIKSVFYESRLSATEFALQINKSRTVVYDIFRRSTIDTGLLLQIGKVLDYDFFMLYVESKKSKGEIEKYLAKIAELEKENKLLERLNNLLEEKRKKK